MGSLFLSLSHLGEPCHVRSQVRNCQMIRSVWGIGEGGSKVSKEKQKVWRCSPTLWSRWTWKNGLQQLFPLFPYCSELWEDSLLLARFTFSATFPSTTTMCCSMSTISFQEKVFQNIRILCLGTSTGNSASRLNPFLFSLGDGAGQTSGSASPVPSGLAQLTWEEAGRLLGRTHYVKEQLLPLPTRSPMAIVSKPLKSLVAWKSLSTSFLNAAASMMAQPILWEIDIGETQYKNSSRSEHGNWEITCEHMKHNIESECSNNGLPYINDGPTHCVRDWNTI